MRLGKSLRIGLVSALLVPGGAMVAAGAPAQAAPSAAVPSSSEQAFLRQALDINQAELTLGRLALERGSSGEVKQMATKMVEKHTALQKQLVDLAQQRGVTAPEASPKEQATYDRLEKLSGPQFDAAFKQAVAAYHTQELALHRNELANGSDPALRSYAQSRVTALEQSMAQPAPQQPAKPKREW